MIACVVAALIFITSFTITILVLDKKIKKM